MKGSPHEPGRALRVAFVISSMGVGGAETLLLDLVRGIDRRRVDPQIYFLWERGPLGDVAARDVPTFDHLLRNRIDAAVVLRMAKLFREQQVDAIVTVCAGDKMFWGRLAAAWARVPVILSALHSTGWPEELELPNRALTPLTTGFIAVADAHRRFLIERERLPAEKVFVVRNGVDVDRFQFDATSRDEWRRKLGIPAAAPVVGIVAALRPEKDHELFVRCAREVARDVPGVHFVVAGQGPEKERAQAVARDLGLTDRVHFLGLVDDVRGVMSMLDLVVLTSRNEASPVSVLEAMACARPVVAPRVGSVAESVLDGVTGLLARVGDRDDMRAKWTRLLLDPGAARAMGEDGRRHVVRTGSLRGMTEGYENLILRLHRSAEDPSRGGESG